jgi:hypothetical protein
MALLKSLDKGYTKTGGSFFDGIANSASYIPFIGGAIVGFIGTLVDTGRWLFRGKFLSAATELTAGTVSNLVNAATGSTPMWLINAGSGVATGVSAGTHARKLTESAIGGITGMFGAKPQVLSSYTAGIGSIGGGAAQAGPGKFVSQEASRRGESADAAYARLQSGQADHVAALESAQQQSYSMGGRA